jgi:membrane protein implicated in regulation of membrane protease activity
LLLAVPQAAEALHTTEEALRARLRRAQAVDARGHVTAPLGPGIVGLKVGTNTWRVRFDDVK